RTFETPSCFSKIDATFRRSKTFADPFSPSASSCFLNHQHRRMGKAGWPSLSICALHVNLPPMTIDASVDFGGNALLYFGVVILAAGASSRFARLRQRAVDPGLPAEPPRAPTTSRGGAGESFPGIEECARRNAERFSSDTAVQCGPL